MGQRCPSHLAVELARVRNNKFNTRAAQVCRIFLRVRKAAYGTAWHPSRFRGDPIRGPRLGVACLIRCNNASWIRQFGGTAGFRPCRYGNFRAEDLGRAHSRCIGRTSQGRRRALSELRGIMAHEHQVHG